MMNQPNTIYEIRYDFDLDGETVEIPEGCTLKFEGGVIRNGKLNLNGTKIKNANGSIDCKLEGMVRGAEFIATDWFILSKNGKVDESARLDNIAQFARMNDLPLCIGRGTYLINQTIDINNSFDHMFKGWFGCGNKASIICTENNSQPILSINDGSGVITNGIIKDIGFKGNNNSSIGVQIAAACGIKIEQCDISGFDYGVQLLNRRKGFTEDFIAQKCHFANTISALRYKREDGTESFHGSGLIDCWIDKGSVITVEENCLVYNAPLTFRAFVNSSTIAIINNGIVGTVFHGNISVEGNDGVIADGKRNTLFQGNVSILGKNTLGNLTQCFYEQAYGPSRSNMVSNASYQTYKKYNWVKNETYKLFWDASYIIINSVKKIFLKTPLCVNTIYGGQAYPVSPIITNNKDYVMKTMGFKVNGDNLEFTPTEDMEIYVSNVENFAHRYSVLQ